MRRLPETPAPARKPLFSSRSTTVPAEADFVHLMYHEFRWQRKLNTLLVAGLILLLPVLMWWMQTANLSSTDTADTQPNSSTSTTSDQQTTKTQMTSAPSSNANTPGSNGAQGTQGVPGQNGSPGPAGPAGQSGSSLSAGTGDSCLQINCVLLASELTGSPQDGNINVSGTVKAAYMVGDGSGLTNIDATTLAGHTTDYYTDADNLQTGTLGVANGGTGQTSLPVNGILVGNGDAAINALSGSNGQCLTISGSSPSFGNCPTGNLQTAYDADDGQTADITTNPTHTSLVIRDKSYQNNNPAFQIQNSGGSTIFSVNAAMGSASVGGNLGTMPSQFNVALTNPQYVGQTIQAATGQTADLLRLNDATGSPLARVDALGNAFFTSVTQTAGTSNFSLIQATGNIQTDGNVGIGVDSPLARLQIAASPAVIGQIIKAAPLQVADLFQIQDQNGVPLLRVDSNGQLYANNISVATKLTINGHLSASGTTPSISSTVTGLLPTITGSDTAGTIVLTSALGASIGTMAHVTFASSYTIPPEVVLTANSADAASLNAYINVTANGFDIISSHAAANAAVCSFSYIVIE